MAGGYGLPTALEFLGPTRSRIRRPAGCRAWILRPYAWVGRGFLLRLCAGAVVLGLALGGAAGSAASGGLQRLVAPADGHVYLGLTVRLWDSADPTWGDTRPFAARIDDIEQHELGGKHPAFLTVYLPWGAPLSSVSAWITQVNAVTGRKLLYIDWTLAQGATTTHDMASGTQDTYIISVARELKAYRGAVLVRLFGGEFNGSWWKNVSPRANPHLTTADFVNAWRRVAGLVKAAGAVNVSWAWIPNAFPPDAVPWVDSNLAAYYPGDDVVDWTGADLYDNLPVSDLDGAYAFATAHSKPFFLAEWGVRHGDSTLTPAGDQAWIETVFAYVRSHPAVKASAYFDYKAQQDRSTTGHVFLDDGTANYAPAAHDFDHRLIAESGADFRGTFARGVSDYLTSAETLDAAPPSAPTVAVHVQGRRVTLRVSGNGTQFEIQIRRGSGAWKDVHRKVVTLVPGRYSVRARASNAAGAGPWSRPRSFTVH
jgi:hypothetical protein